MSFNRSRSGSFNGRTQPQTQHRSPRHGVQCSMQQSSQNSFNSGHCMNENPQPTVSRPMSHVPHSQHTRVQPRTIHSAPPQRTHAKAAGVPSRPSSAIESSAASIQAGEHKDFCPSYTLAFGLGMVNRSDAGCIVMNPRRRVLQECVPPCSQNVLGGFSLAKR